MGNLSDLLGNNFDATKVEVRSFSPIPEGVYDVEIEGAERRELKSGKGEGVMFTFVVTGPTHVGRKLFENLNMRHENKTAQDIGISSYSEICLAVNHPKCVELDELIGRSLRVRVKVRKQEGYDDKNEIVGHSSIDGAAPTADTPKAKPTPATKAPPWKQQHA